MRLVLYISLLCVLIAGCKQDVSPTSNEEKTTQLEVDHKAEKGINTLEEKKDQPVLKEGKKSPEEKKNTEEESEVKASTSVPKNNKKSTTPVEKSSAEHSSTSPPTKKKARKPKKTIGKIEFDKPIHDYGKIESGEEVNHDFLFKNMGDGPLNIVTASATCGCTVPSYPFLPIEPGEGGKIGVYFNSVGKEGKEEPVITITTDGEPKLIKLKLTGEVLPKKEEKKEKQLPQDTVQHRR